MENELNQPYPIEGFQGIQILFRGTIRSYKWYWCNDPPNDF